ncbi:MAG: glycosyltransferase family 39 protein [bacterium]|nr:glycosyltransferase family 39 protein [Candidatus Kapabacteria bacterium]
MINAPAKSKLRGRNRFTTNALNVIEPIPHRDPESRTPSARRGVLRAIRVASVSRRQLTWIATIILALVLLPAALYSPGNDSSLYFVSGQKILHQGAAHYRDIVDVKPPLIYYLYAVSAAVFGSHSQSYRLLDYMLQLATALMIAALVARYAGRTEGFIAALIYACMYVAQSYNGTALTESYVGLFAVPMILLQLKRRRRSHFVGIGFLAGGLFLLKFSLMTSLGVAIVAELMLFDDTFARRARNVALMIAGFAGAAALLPLYLTVFDAWIGFAEMNAFLTGYLQNQTPGIGAAVREALTALPSYFTDEFSLAMLALCAIGMMLGFTGPSDESPDDARISNRTRLLRLATLNALVMIAGVVLEAKYRAFHFSRLLPFAAIVAGIALVWITNEVRRRRPLGSYAWALLLVIVPVAIIVSPIARYVRHSAAVAFWIAKGPEGFDRMYYTEELGYSYVQLAAMRDTIRSREVRYTIGDVRDGGPNNDAMFVSSGVAGLVYAFAGKIPEARIYHSAFLIAPYSPPQWRRETSRYLVERQPRFIVAHLNDSMEEMTGSRLSSADMLRTLPGVDSLLRNAYDTAYASNHFELYERRRR